MKGSYLNDPCRELRSGEREDDGLWAWEVNRAVHDLWREIASVAPLAWMAWANPFLDQHEFGGADADVPCPEDLSYLACIWGVQLCPDCEAESEDTV